MILNKLRIVLSDDGEQIDIYAPTPRKRIAVFSIVIGEDYGECFLCEKAEKNKETGRLAILLRQRSSRVACPVCGSKYKKVQRQQVRHIFDLIELDNTELLETDEYEYLIPIDLFFQNTTYRCLSPGCGLCYKADSVFLPRGCKSVFSERAVTWLCRWREDGIFPYENAAYLRKKNILSVSAREIYKLEMRHSEAEPIFPENQNESSWIKSGHEVI